VLQRGDVSGAERAAVVLALGAEAGAEPASTIATPDVLAAIVSASGRVGMAASCTAVLCSVAGASPPLALRVADTPGVEAALLAALTSSDLTAASNATNTVRHIARTDAQRIARLLSAPEVPPALARLLQRNDDMMVGAITCEGVELLLLFGEPAFGLAGADAAPPKAAEGFLAV
jgi:hypothetical protein